MATGKAKKVDAAIANARNTNFALDISHWVKKAKGNTNAVIRKIIFDLAARVIMRTPVDTGRARGNWMFAVGNPNLKNDNPADIQTPANAEGAGASHAKDKVMTGALAYNPESGQSIFLTNSVPYILRLEYGWSKQAPRGMVRLTVNEFQNLAKNAANTTLNSKS